MDEVTSTEEVKTIEGQDQESDSGASDKVETKTEINTGNEATSRYKQDMLKYKDKVKDLEAKMESDRVNKLKEQERFQELAEEFRAKYESEADKNQRLNAAVVNDRKFSAVKEAALQAGIRKEALADLELIGLDDVEIETTSTGRINVLNADKSIEKLKMTRPHWFGKKSVNINMNDPDIGSSSIITFDDIFKAEKDAKKTGDYTQYKSLLNKFQSQKQQ